MGGIIWLASYPKSGNTWARLFLYNLLLNPQEPLDINRIRHLTLIDGLKSWYEKAGGQPYDKYSMGEVALLRPKVHELFAKSQPDSVFVKTHSMFGTVYGVPQITLEQTAGAIYIIRNPLDVVISLSSHFGLPIEEAITMLNDPEGGGDEARGYEHIRQLFGSWSGHANSWSHFDPRHMHVMRYEDMLDEPEEAFGGMARFLGLNPPKDRLDRAIEFSSFDVVRRQEEEKGFKEQSDKNDRFFRVGKAGQWKDVLTDDQVDRIVKCHYPTMKHFGYLRD
ncbi:MAG: sulfotransferase domain-containing protein [Sneathiella sp.]|nr:sulfotransferase domain-containing protein [Sneathiella sp.]